MIAVPVHYTPELLRTVARAARIAGFSSIRLIKETIATSTTFQRRVRSEEPITVAFVDIGASAAALCVARMNRSATEILHLGVHSGLGSCQLDRTLAAFISGNPQGSFSEKLVLAAQALKKKLTVSEKAAVTASGGTTMVTRKQFETQAEDYRQELEKFMSSALAKFGGSVDEVHSFVAFNLP